MKQKISASRTHDRGRKIVWYRQTGILPWPVHERQRVIVLAKTMHSRKHWRTKRIADALRPLVGEQLLHQHADHSRTSFERVRGDIAHEFLEVGFDPAASVLAGEGNLHISDFVISGMANELQPEVRW